MSSNRGADRLLIQWDTSGQFAMVRSRRRGGAPRRVSAKGIERHGIVKAYFLASVSRFVKRYTRSFMSSLSASVDRYFLTGRSTP